MKAKKHGIKCVVWDLDNTVWHGVLAENDELRLRDNIAHIITTLDQRGVLQSIASKNTHDEAWRKLKAFGLDHFFLYPQINWGAKSQSLAAIKEKLNIGFDAIAFIDDQEFERDEVNFEHADVACYDVDIIAGMLSNDVFMPRFITDESARRRQMYQADAVRNEEEERSANNSEFLASLAMEFAIHPANIDDLQRVEELTVRTNQLNATGYTYSYEELAAFLHSDRHKLFVAELVDKYGSYGKIGVALLECEDDTWRIKLLLMSCRVMARGVGTVLLQYLMNLARANDKKLVAEFKHTDRNRIMYVTYKFAGFTLAESLPDGGELLTHPLTDEVEYPANVRLRIAEESFQS